MLGIKTTQLFDNKYGNEAFHLDVIKVDHKLTLSFTFGKTISVCQIYVQKLTHLLDCGEQSLATAFPSIHPPIQNYTFFDAPKCKHADRGQPFSKHVIVFKKINGQYI